ncbi:MAG: hypothetical protein ACYS7Y_36350 [Planctomycetota bacterium]|jgi:hypothetical protein
MNSVAVTVSDCKRPDTIVKPGDIFLITLDNNNGWYLTTRLGGYLYFVNLESGKYLEPPSSLRGRPQFTAADLNAEWRVGIDVMRHVRGVALDISAIAEDVYC